MGQSDGHADCMQFPGKESLIWEPFQAQILIVGLLLLYIKIDHFKVYRRQVSDSFNVCYTDRTVKNPVEIIKHVMYNQHWVDGGIHEKIVKDFTGKLCTLVALNCIKR